jgi:hypothetical protein
MKAISFIKRCRRIEIEMRPDLVAKPYHDFHYCSRHRRDKNDRDRDLAAAQNFNSLSSVKGK